MSGPRKQTPANTPYGNVTVTLERLSDLQTSAGSTPLLTSHDHHVVMQQPDTAVGGATGSGSWNYGGGVRFQ